MAEDVTAPPEMPPDSGKGAQGYCGFSLHPLAATRAPFFHPTPLPKPTGSWLVRESGKCSSLQYRVNRERQGLDLRKEARGHHPPTIAHGPTTMMWQGQVWNQDALESTTHPASPRKAKGR